MRVQDDDDWVVRNQIISSMVRGWRNDPEILFVLKTYAQTDRNWDVRAKAASELAVDWKDDPETLHIFKAHVLNDSNEYVRAIAVEGLVEGWKDDPETLHILKACAQIDDSDSVRSTAVSELSKAWKYDLRLFDFWCDRTLQDPFKREHDWQDNPRQIALNVLVQQYPNHPKTRELLRDRAQNDNDEQLRTWANEQLTRLES